MKTFLPFIIIGVSIGMYFLYISPLMMEIGDKRIIRSDYQSILQKAKELKVRRDDLLKAYNNIPTTDQDRLAKIIPEKFDPVLFLNNTTATIQKYGMTLVDFSANQSRTAVRDVESAEGGEEQPSYKTITSSIKIVGQYAQFVKFLKDIETNLQIVDVTELGISGFTVTGTDQKTTGNVSTSNMTYTLTFNTYALN